MASIKNQLSNKINSEILDSMFNHGIEAFGTKENFEIWLKKKNFFFDKKAPIELMNTTEGIKFIDDRLIGMAYGDNA